MTVSDQSRHRLHQRLDELLGVEEAATLMEHLPPVGWADVATKRDLEHFAAELRNEMRVMAAELRTEMHDLGGALRAELHQGLAAQRGQLVTLFLGLLGLQCTAAGLAVAVSKIL